MVSRQLAQFCRAWPVAEGWRPGQMDFWAGLEGGAAADRRYRRRHGGCPCTKPEYSEPQERLSKQRRYALQERPDRFWPSEKRWL